MIVPFAAQRHGYVHISIAITVDLSFCEWAAVFRDAKTTTALVYRAYASLPRRRDWQ
ncbi:hypothetical protein [Paraburkholderia sp. BR10882]|uniref:hypothetical protein n=1 Tax=unclassified Paraburkholderia TaxID=2615204 RepID=UPI0034CEE38B